MHPLGRSLHTCHHPLLVSFFFLLFFCLETPLAAVVPHTIPTTLLGRLQDSAFDINIKITTSSFPPSFRIRISEDHHDEQQQQQAHQAQRKENQRQNDQTQPPRPSNQQPRNKPAHIIFLSRIPTQRRPSPTEIPHLLERPFCSSTARYIPAHDEAIRRLDLIRIHPFRSGPRRCARPALSQNCEEYRWREDLYSARRSHN